MPKMLLSKFVLENDCVTLNLFNNYVYFMDDMVDRSLMIGANNNLILVSDELWQFGPDADGCLAKIRFAIK